MAKVDPSAARPLDRGGTRLRVEFVREADGSVLTRYLRADGTSTWHRHVGGRAEFFPWHDLLHYAIETELAIDCGFYALIAEGWDIGDFEKKAKRDAHLDPRAGLVEHLVNLFGTEINSGTPFPAAELNALMMGFADAAGIPPLRAFSDAELENARRGFRDLEGRWKRTGAGNALDLVWDRRRGDALKP